MAVVLSTFSGSLVYFWLYNHRVIPDFYSHGISQSCGVFIACFGNLNFSVNKQVGNKNGRILILDVNIDEIVYVLVNIYNANTEVQHVIVS